MNKLYYYELEDTSCGPFEYRSSGDAKTINFLKETYKDVLLCVYTESDTPDGTPFIMLYDKNKN